MNRRNGQESFDELEQQCDLHNLRIVVGMRTGNPDRDAVIQKEKIIQKLYAHKKDVLLPNNPFWSLYKALHKELIDIRRDIVEDLSTLQPDDSESSFDELEQQCALQILRIVVGMRTGNPDRDAAIQREEIIQKLYAHKKDALLPNDPFWSFYKSLYKELIDIRRDIAKDLSTLQPDDSESFFPKRLITRFDDKIKEWVDSGKMTGLKVGTEESDLYAKALGAVDEHLDCLNWYRSANVPPLSVLFGVDEVNDMQLYIPEYQKIQLTKYPDIAEQRRDVYRKLLVHDLNSSIKKEDQWIGNIEAGLQQLDESNTEIARYIKETVVITLRDNLLGADKDLKERTIALLQQAPVLKQMIWDGPEMEKMLTDHKMILAKIMKHKDKTKGHLGNVQKAVLPDIGKY